MQTKYKMNWAKKTRLTAKLRFYSGWILFIFAFTHLINHSFGILGLNAIERARLIFIGFWRLPVLEWLVAFSFFVHFSFALNKLYNKSTFKGMTRAEWFQIIIGLLIPLFVVPHFMSTKIANLRFEVQDSYSYYLYAIPDYVQYLISTMLILVWAHGSIGIIQYLKQKKWYHRWSGTLIGMAVAIPILALWGTVTVIKEVNILQDNVSWVTALVAVNNPNDFDVNAWEESWVNEYSGGYLLFLLFFFSARQLRQYARNKKRNITIKYLEGAEVTISKGSTLLEASLLANIPHAHVCGGRGRCSTCRVQVVSGLAELPPPSNDEQKLLYKIGAQSTVRLACRTRPVTNCTVYPLLAPNIGLGESLWKKNAVYGIDRDVAILFADLRGFTSFAEDKLPYDVVFILNQYFQFMGHAIEMYQGRIDKFIGDAIMAVFGLSRNRKEACRDALHAARSMRFQLDRLNSQFHQELREPLQMGFGIHCGRVIIGEMGYKLSTNLVAIGDATNTASRLESLTKKFKAELIVSSKVVEWAEVDFSAHSRYEVELKGKQKPIEVYSVGELKEFRLGKYELQINT